MVRWIALASKGKKGECLYPGKSNPEMSYCIDELVECSDSYMNKDWANYVFKEATEEEAKVICQGTWCEMLTKLED
jgi:hypothetical protein